MVVYYTNEFGNRKGESHELLALALERHTGASGSELVSRMKLGEMGKPSIDGVCDFSISHSNNMWAVLFDDAPCGLDIQHHQEVSMDKIADRWYHEDEKKYIDSLSGEDKVVAFYNIWARREALVKAVGTTIINSKLPSTLGDEVQFMGQNWKLKDFTMTGASNISVAFCTKEEGPMNIVWLGGIDA